MGVSPACFGVGIAAGGVGSVIGAYGATRLCSAYITKTMAVGVFLISAGLCGISLLKGNYVVYLFSVYSLVSGAGSALFNISIVSFIHKNIQKDIMSSVVGAMFSFSTMFIPAGALIGSAMATAIGNRLALITSSIGMASLFIVMSSRIIYNSNGFQATN